MLGHQDHRLSWAEEPLFTFDSQSVSFASALANSKSNTVDQHVTITKSVFGDDSGLHS